MTIQEHVILVDLVNSVFLADFQVLQEDFRVLKDTPEEGQKVASAEAL